MKIYIEHAEKSCLGGSAFPENQEDGVSVIHFYWVEDRECIFMNGVDDQITELKQHLWENYRNRCVNTSHDLLMALAALKDALKYDGDKFDLCMTSLNDIPMISVAVEPQAPWAF
ncbi:hypothetical protein NRY68_05935 [Acidithiobacillus ferrooxidans]|uniref:hypothetical protein n=1 Tax=Acidithiobacillus ferrooxidans TaxID=920 RepID=UPI002147FA6B|nr:hypothetical protein [Acidithiobacillus ferrooxidans]MCR1345347.1 hypothetical protein [Acidithiobacillus ferrooxidans]MCR1354507.1 hypothetical protein [Acidithiobacillus ferrooxidans]